MSKLLYHRPENPVAESPFDRAIVELARGQDVKIVSPYISLSYLERIIRMSRSWQLISDVFEWLSATPDRERSAVYEFLKRNEGVVHYYPAIHAKTVISQTAAYTGSANLTDAGVLRRTEFGVLLRDKAQVDEIHQWFAALWAQTSPPALDRVQELVASLNQLANSPFAGLDLRETHLESSAPKVRAKLVKLLGDHPVSLVARPKERASHAALVLQPPSVVEAPAASPATLPVAVASTTALTSPPVVTLRHELFDLDRAVMAYVERNAYAGFTLGDLHRDLALRSAALRVREAYFAIAPHCASLSRSLLELDAVNRLVYREGRFVQSSRPYLEEALAPLDALMEWLFMQLSFSEPRPLPEVAPAQLQPGVPRATYRLLLKQLEAAGFLRVGQGVQLNPAATWSARLRLLNRAYPAWCAALAKHQLMAAVKPTVGPAGSGQEKPSTGGVGLAHGAVGVQGAVTDVDADAEEQTHRAMEEERKLAPQGALHQSKTLANLDVAYECLAQLYLEHGETVDMSFDALRESISALTSLPKGESEKVLNGSFSFIQSPFMAVSAASRKAQVKLYPLLEGNPDLLRLPKTKALVEGSEKLTALAQPKTAQKLSA